MRKVTTTSVRSDVNSSVPGFLLSKTFVAVWSFAFALFFFGFATKWTFDPMTIGSFWPGRFFSAQADAILNGRLWIDNSYLPGECSFVDGKCYGYFGVAPSLIRLPLVSVFGIVNSEMTALFLSIAAGISLWSALDLCRRVLQRDCPRVAWQTAGYMAIAAVVLGPGGALMLVSDAYVYAEAILWSVAGMLLGANLFWRWWTEGKDRQFVGATLLLMFAAGSRPTAVLVGAVFAALVFVGRLFQRRLTLKAILGAIGIAVLPLMALTGGFYAKYGTPLPTGRYEGTNYVYIQRIMENNGGPYRSSSRFVPTAALAYLRPDSMRVSTDWPWVRFRFGRPFGDKSLERITYLPPLRDDSINVEPVVSLTDVMPIPLLATAAASVAIVLRRRQRFELVMLVGLATTLIIMLPTQTIASRYLGDFFPLLAVGTAFGATLVPRFRRLSGRVQAYSAVAIATVAVASVPIAMLLATQYNWTYRYGIQ